MTELVHQRCLHHPSREAAARCPECRRFFCRECTVEHRGRMICASCMGRIAETPVVGNWRASLWAACAAAGFFLAWLIFYYAGLMLARAPSDFFEVTR
ncbi:MAG TPA: hypothetical protein VKX39_00050 [Bryobacteraceae bacterium]|jgi:hypothetical protein|nr:hypothetical protein [Bryobacteraceae bacterium]